MSGPVRNLAAKELPIKVSEAAKKHLRPWNFKWMPSENIILTGCADMAALKKSSTLRFKVPKHMNKFEIKEYLQKLYGIEATKIETTIFRGQKKTRDGGRHFFRQPGFKRAVIHLDRPSAVKGEEVATTAAGESPSVPTETKS